MFSQHHPLSPPPSVYAYMLEKSRPDLVRKMAAMDVGGGICWWPSFSSLLIVAYQTYLITAFLIGGPIGNTMARMLARSAGGPPASNAVRASVCYPYWHYWKTQISSCFSLGPFTPRCPALLMYGTTGFKKVLVSVFFARINVFLCIIVFGYSGKR